MPRAPKKCGHPACTERIPGGTPYCPEHTRERQARANTTARGYGHEHQQLRAAWEPKVATGIVHCWRCDQPIHAGQPWHLGHDDHDRTRYRGPEHARCNTQAAAQGKAQGVGHPSPGASQP